MGYLFDTEKSSMIFQYVVGQKLAYSVILLAFGPLALPFRAMVAHPCATRLDQQGEVGPSNSAR